MNTPLDPKVAAVLDNHHQVQADDDLDEDALLATLDEDSAATDAFRAQRIEQLSAELSRSKAMKAQSFGSVTTAMTEKEVLDITTSTQYSLVHFFKPDFHRCSIMDSHLETLAPKHFDTRFLRLDVDNAPFLATRLAIKVLPCVLAFINGVSVARIVGFEGLAASEDSFTTADLERRLLSTGVLTRVKIGSDGTRIRRIGKIDRAEAEANADDDDDWE
ncbi:MAG: hypothetical protein M1829_004252 [Trizodia sp. TS-e1964]|nr:MAG: hypothetical protein M1829_004252 [Trizodia sp. TS-e1964]